jgi:hypothetical protein
MKQLLLKKLPILLMIGVLTMSISESYGHAQNKIRSSCTTWKNKYKSKASVSDLGIPLCIDTHGSCVKSTAYCSKSCGIAQASASSSTNLLSTSIFNGGFLCGAGITPSDLYQHYWNKKANNLFGNKTYLMSNSLDYQLNFDKENRLVAISEASGELRILKGFAGIVELRFSTWRAEDDYVNEIEDEDMTTEKILSEEYIRIQNDEIHLSEGLKNNPAIEIIEDAEEYIIIINNLEFNLSVPEDVDFDEELVVTITSASDPDNEKAQKAILDEGSKNKNLSVSPNPIENQFKLTLENVKEETDVNINLYDINGRLIQVLYQGIVVPKQELLLNLGRSERASSKRNILYYSVQ